ncbi:hypothetical protein BGZ97_009323, partial [Linnemannia gamsii]
CQKSYHKDNIQQDEHYDQGDLDISVNNTTDQGYTLTTTGRTLRTKTQNVRYMETSDESDESDEDPQTEKSYPGTLATANNAEDGTQIDSQDLSESRASNVLRDVTNLDGRSKRKGRTMESSSAGGSGNRPNVSPIMPAQSLLNHSSQKCFPYYACPKFAQSFVPMFPPLCLPKACSIIRPKNVSPIMPAQSMLKSCIPNVSPYNA